MYPTGHFGIGLLLFAPLGYLLVVRNGTRELAPGLTAALLSTLAPDVDVFVPALAHRGATHTLLAAGCLGTLVAVCWCVSDRGPLGDWTGRAAFGFVVGAVGVAGHLLGDVVTPMGIQPFLPLDRTTYTLSLVHARNVWANVALLGCGVAVYTASVRLARRSPPIRGDRTDEASVDGVGSDADLG